MNNELLRQKLRHDLLVAREETDELFRLLAPEAIHERPISERHRIIFYLGHFEAFDWNMICAQSFGAKSFNSQFDRLFEFGIDPVDGRLPHDQPSDWPAIEEIISYRNRVRATVDDLLEHATFTNSSQPFVENGQIFHVAIEHRLMHAETLAYMFHWLDYSLKRRPARGATVSADRSERSRPTLSEVRIPSGDATLGQARDTHSFGWDNEFEAHRVFVPEFSIDTFNVTNADFLEFVNAGGYDHKPLWGEEDWTWIQEAIS